MSVYKKLNEARAKFHELKLTKTGRNTFANYNYFELGDFLIPALQVFREVGLCAYVSFDKDTATMTIVDLAPSGGAPEKIILTSPMGSAALKGCHEVQNIGAVETYQRRYLWVAALEIVEHDALDATTGKEVIAKSFRSSPTMGAMDEVEDPDRVLYLTMLASTVQAKVQAGDVATAHHLIEKEKFDDTDKTALWSLLDSKTRSAIKRHIESTKAKEAA